jgi:hypothetical protein
MTVDPRDLSGTWYGRYHGSDGVQTNSFIALLSETAGRVGGSISEPDDLGMEATRRASVDGRRVAAQLAFVKQYDGAVLLHAVHYIGTISDDGLEVRGSWSFDRYAGSFVMTRERFTRDALAAEEGELVR